MTTEAEMKKALDGYFYWFDRSFERVGRSVVPIDFIPDHTPEADEDSNAKNISYAESGRKGGLTKRRAWTQQDDELLMELRAQGLRWQHVGKRLGRGDKGCRLRYLELCAARELVPAPCKPTERKPLTERQRGQIVQMNADGLTYDEIDQTLGLPEFSARDFITHYRRALLERRAAA